MNIDYSHYSEDDYADFAEMVFSLYDEDPKGEPIAESKINKTVSESGRHPEKVQIIMFRAGDVNVGYGIVTCVWSNEFGGNVIIIDELYVKKEYRNKKVATNYFKFIQETFKDAVLFELEVTPSNKSALGFYQYTGFEASSKKNMFMHARKA